MTTTKRATVLNTEDVKNLRYPIPLSWKKAAGMLKGRKRLENPVTYQHKIRKEWETRFKRQTRLAQKD
jgi:hypothetical protein